MSANGKGLLSRPRIAFSRQGSNQLSLRIYGGVLAKVRNAYDGPELEGRLLHVVPQVALRRLLSEDSERSVSVVGGKMDASIHPDHGCRLTTPTRGKSEVTITWRRRWACPCNGSEHESRACAALSKRGSDQLGSRISRARDGGGPERIAKGRNFMLMC